MNLTAARLPSFFDTKIELSGLEQKYCADTLDFDLRCVTKRGSSRSKTVNRVIVTR